MLVFRVRWIPRRNDGSRIIFIIVEGATCTGKSTLIEQLKERLELDTQVQYEHKDRPQELTRRWVLRDYVLNHENYKPDAATPRELNPSLLSDRWHYGEATYAPIYRPDTNTDGFGLLGQAGWRWVELFLMSRGALVVRLDASDEVLKHRLALRGDDHVTDETELLQVVDRYRATELFSPVTEMIIDTSDDQPVNVDPIWFKALQLEAASAAVLEITPEYIGNLLPDVLLVGDKRNVTKDWGNETSLPFMPVDQSSGIYLLDSLPIDFWQHVGMVNGNDMSGDLRKLWETLGRPRPVALGKNAERALIAAGFTDAEYTALRHPAHARRFAFSEQPQYGASIVEAATLKGIYA